MKKFITTGLFGLICFASGVLIQYVSIASVAHKNHYENKTSGQVDRWTGRKIPDVLISNSGSVESWEIPVVSFDRNNPETFNLQASTEAKEEEIEAYARQITVKVLSGQNSGSGIIISRKNGTYQVLTNDHVLLFGRQNNVYQIKTNDGVIHTARKVNDYNFQNYDLGILEFTSRNNYTVAVLSNQPFPAINEVVYGVGFPYTSSNNIRLDNFTFTSGKVNLISDLSFRGGYQIGSSNDIVKGMSGGALLNSEGKIIGINGRHKYPAWGNPYVFEDGSIAPPDKKAQMIHSSWAIPINTFLRFVPQLSAEN